jgi:hypothetical protein
LHLLLLNQNHHPIKISIKYIVIYALILFLGIQCKEPEKQVGFEELPADLRADSTNRWILKILNYESCCGAADGTGLAYWGMYRQKPASIEQAISAYKKEYLPRVITYPPGIRERLGDYYFNTGRRPEDLLLFAAGFITLDQINGAQKWHDRWQEKKAEINLLCQDPAFIYKLDQAKEQVYSTTKMINGKSNPAYELTWKPRVRMWNENN